MLNEGGCRLGSWRGEPQEGPRGRGLEGVPGV